MQPPDNLTTDRLTMRRVDSLNEERVFNLFNGVANPDRVFNFCGWTHHESQDKTREYLEQAQRQWRTGERYRYGVILTEQEALVGTTYIDVGSVTEAGVLGLWLDEPYWGRGISGERANRIIALGFEHFGLTHIRVGCLSANHQSRRAIEKYIGEHGGVYYGTPPVTASSYSAHPQPTRPHHEYAIRRQDYESDATGITTTIPGVSYETVRHAMEKRD